MALLLFTVFLLTAAWVVSLGAPAQVRGLDEPPPLDFSRSFAWLGMKDGFNDARIQLESRCLVIDTQRGTSEEFFLGATCMGENTYGADGDLTKVPTYDFSPIFSKDEYRVIRLFSNGTGKSLVSLQGSEDTVRFQIVKGEKPEVLREPRDIVRATIEGHPIIGRVEITYRGGALRAIIDYPVKTMNTCVKKGIFQVDTGPVLYPDLESPPRRTMEAFEKAFVICRTFETAELVLLKPTYILEGVKDAAKVEGLDRWKPSLLVNHYSAVKKISGRNTFMAIR